MKWYQYILVVMVILGIVAFASFIVYNLKDVESITIYLENDAQLRTLIDGRIPDITFYSVQDTPYGEHIKILRVRTHFVWGENLGMTMDKHLTNWLDSIGVTSYPKFPINYIEDKPER